MAALERQKADLDKIVVEMAETGPTSVRHAHNQAVNELLQRHGLRLLDESPATQGGGKKLPKSMTAALARLAQDRQPAPAGRVQAAARAPLDNIVYVRSVRFTGRFADVLAAVRELSQAPNPFGVPVTLSMDEANSQTEDRRWTLLVWM